MEHFDETQNPLKIYFMEKIHSLYMAMPLKQAVPAKRSSNTVSRQSVNSNNEATIPEEVSTNSLMPINQIKNIRYKKFELEQKLSVKKKEVNVEGNVKEYHNQLAENQILVKDNLEKQKLEFVRKLQQRKEKSHASNSQIRNL